MGKRIIVALVVIILAVFTGFTAAYFILRGFRGEVHSDNTELFPIDMENCPTVIEAKYYLPELPEGFVFSAYAETMSLSVDIGVSPLYEIAVNPKSNLSIIGKTAYCTSDGEGINAVSITVEQTLQKQGFLWSWSGVKDAKWTKTVNSSVISFSNTKSDLESGKYRLKSVFTLTDKNGKTEKITVYSAEKSVS